MAQNKKIRSQVEMNNPDLNYFIAFKINTKETDVTKIKDALTKKRNTFAAQQTVINSRLVELKEDIDQIMLNDATYDPNTDSYAPNTGGRALEAQNAINFNFKRAIEAVTGICARGYIWDYELQQVADKNEVNFDELYKKVEQFFKQGVTYKKTTGAKREVPFKKFEEIDNNLKTLNKKDIYDFLGVSMSINNADLETNRNTAYSTYQKQGKSANQTAAINLCGLIKLVGKSDQSRREYNIYCLTKDVVWNRLKVFKESGIKEINEKVLTEVTQNMMQATGMKAEQTEQEIAAYLQNFGLVVSGSNSAVVDFEECPYENCGKLYINKPGLKFCPNCGQPLEVVCWNCGKTHPFTSKQKVCTNCGSNRVESTIFDNDVKAFNAKLNQASVTESELNIEYSKFENKYKQRAKTGSLVAKQLEVIRNSINKKVQDLAKRKQVYDTYVKEINASMAQKAYMKANDILLKLKAADPTYDVKSIESIIKTAVDKARQFAENAKSFLARNDETNVIDSAGKALEACADYTIATQILKNFPPKDPTNVTATVTRQNVKIEWKIIGNTTAVTYDVIRKVGSVPANDEDGTIIGKDLTINFFEDSAVSPATTYYYAIYAKRGGVRSRLINAQNPVTLFLEVSNVHQELVANAIKVSWTLPENAKGIEVYRKVGTIPPQTPSEGEKIAIKDTKGFDDSTSSENVNSYLIRCKYNINGKDYYSQGLKVTFKKIKMPEPITDAKLNAVSDTDFEVTFTDIETGSVKLYLSDKAYDYNFGTAEYRINFASRCKELKPIDFINVSMNKLRFTVPNNTIKWLYLVVTTDQLYLINKPLVVNTISGLSNINVINKGGNITIEGDLVGNVRNLIAKISTTGYVKNINEKAEQRTCSKDTFVKDKGFYIALPVGIYYITVFAEFMEGGSIIYSRPTCLPEVIDNREKVQVNFAVEATPSTRTEYKVKVVFHSNQPISLPEIMIVRGFPKPLAKNNGTKVASIPPLDLKKKLLKSGYWAEAKFTVAPANGLKDKLSFFFDDDTVKYIQLKEVMTLK